MFSLELRGPHPIVDFTGLRPDPRPHFGLPDGEVIERGIGIENVVEAAVEGGLDVGIEGIAFHFHAEHDLQAAFVGVIECASEGLLGADNLLLAGRAFDRGPGTENVCIEPVTGAEAKLFTSETGRLAPPAGGGAPTVSERGGEGGAAAPGGLVGIVKAAGGVEEISSGAIGRVGFKEGAIGWAAAMVTVASLVETT